jgi:signal transduction histidine kinase
MKVATKVATGSGMLAAVLIGVLGYFVLLVRHLVVANHELTAVHFRVTTVALELLDQVDQIEVNARKFYVTRDAAYAGRVTKARDGFAAGLAELRALASRGANADPISRLDELWRQFALASLPAGEMAARLAGITDSRIPEVLETPIEKLSRQTWVVLNASRQGIAAQVASVADAGRVAEWVSAAIAGIAILLAVLIVALTVRSIREPLRRLIEGTRTVANGEFTYQLDTGGGDEFAALAEDFNTMVRRLGELDRMKRGFVSHVSHELKTPLVAMQETNRLLLDGLAGPLNERQRRLLDLNLQGSRRLSAMIANLLDLARLEAGGVAYDIRPHELGALAREAMAELEALAHERGVGLELDLPQAPVIVECDADRVTQVLVNLVDNAVKFSPPGGPITVGVRLEPTLPPDAPRAVAAALGPAGVGPFAAVRVADLGPGVPEPEKLRVFEKFRQAHHGSKRAGAGVGLGLAISAEIVRAHAGAIWAADNHPSGSVFAVLLPLAGPGPHRSDAGGATIGAAHEA